MVSGLAMIHIVYVLMARPDTILGAILILEFVKDITYSLLK